MYLLISCILAFYPFEGENFDVYKYGECLNLTLVDYPQRRYITAEDENSIRHFGYHLETWFATPLLEDGTIEVEVDGTTVHHSILGMPLFLRRPVCVDHQNHIVYIGKELVN